MTNHDRADACLAHGFATLAAIHVNVSPTMKISLEGLTVGAFRLCAALGTATVLDARVAHGLQSILALIHIPGLTLTFARAAREQRKVLIATRTDVALSRPEIDSTQPAKPFAAALAFEFVAPPSFRSPRAADAGFHLVFVALVGRRVSGLRQLLGHFDLI